MNNIRNLRKKYNLSQKELAAILNVHQTAVSQWEQGRTSPDIEIAKRMAELFKVSLDVILDNDMHLNKKSDNINEVLSEHEKRVISAYRNNPDLQEGIDMLLKVSKKDHRGDGINIGEDMADTIETASKFFANRTMQTK